MDSPHGRSKVLYSTGMPSPAQATNESSRRLDIQGMRALAVLLVVIFHADLPLPGGFVGVDVFFVISGFVITSLLKTELERSGQINFIKFYQRRIHRLLPALALTSITVAFVGIFLNPIGTLQTTVSTGISATLFVANGYLYRSAPGYFAPGAEFNPLLHTWSLSVEEQFYFVFPIVLWATWRWCHKHRLAISTANFTAALLGCAMVLSFVVSATMSYGSALLLPLSAPSQFAFYAPLTRAWEFAAGGLLAFSPAYFRNLSQTTLGTLSGIGVIFLLGAGLLINGNMVFPGFIALIPVFGAALLIVGGSCRTSLMSRLLSTRPMVWIGDRSYGWYLWHWPFVVFCKAVFPESHFAAMVASVIALIPTMLSYRWVENRFRLSREATASQTLRLFVVCLIGPVLSFGFLSMASKWMLHTANAYPIKQAIELHADTLGGCEDLPPLAADYTGKCRWRVPNSRGLILLLGDSNAGHLTEAVTSAANRLGFDALVSTVPACPFIDRLSFSNGIPNMRCKNFVEGAIKAIHSHKPKLVFIATASDGYIEASSTSIANATEAPVAQTPDDKAVIWKSGLSDLLAQINLIAPVALVHPPPRFHDWALTGCAGYYVWQDPLRCNATLPRREVEKWRQRAMAAEKNAIAMHVAITSIDLNKVLCSEHQCSVRQEGIWMYRDSAHISVPGSFELIRVFEQNIIRIMKQ